MPFPNPGNATTYWAPVRTKHHIRPRGLLVPDDAGGVVGHGGRRWACELRPGTRPAEPEAAWDPPSASARPHPEWSDRIPAAHAAWPRSPTLPRLIFAARQSGRGGGGGGGGRRPAFDLRSAPRLVHTRQRPLLPLACLPACLRTTVRVDNASWAR